MKVGIRLLGTATGKADVEHFKLESNDGKDSGDMQAAFQFFCDNTTIHGLGMHLQAGVITLTAEQNQLRPEVVADIRRTAQAAIDLIN